MTSIWREQRFLAYAIGNIINNFGNCLYMVALPLLVYHITHSALNMSIMTVAEFFPRAIASFFIGAIVDRISRRLVIFVSLSFQAVCSLLIASLYSANVLDMHMLYVLGALIAIGQEFFRTAEIVVIPAMFTQRRVEATAGLSSVFTTMQILGPVLAGIFMTWVGYSSLLWLNSLTFFGPIVLCIWTKIPHETNLGGIRSVNQVSKDTLAGFKYLFSNRLLVDLLLVTIITGIADSGLMTVLLFHLKNDLVASDMFTSWVLAINGIGCLFGSMLIAKYKSRPLGKVLFYTLLVNNIGVLLYTLPGTWMLPISVIIAAIGGLAFNITRNVLIQETVANDMMGRVGGTMRMMSHLTFSISTAMLGAIAGFFTAETAFVVAAVMTFVPSLMIWKSPLYRFGSPEYVQNVQTTDSKVATCP
ncbi:MAG: MFS transporter [Tumebacillaceae bacterium]